MRSSTQQRKLLAASFVTAAGLCMALVPIGQAEAGFLFNNDNKQQLLHSGTSQSSQSSGQGGDSTSITSRSIDASSVSVVPEPTTIVLLGSGLAALGLWKLRRKS